MKSKTITFIWQDMSNNTHNLRQVRTIARTVAEAWDNTRAGIMRQRGLDPDNKIAALDFIMMYAFMGEVTPLDPSVPLRAATAEEKKALLEPEPVT